jgi:predicted metalloprotease with PDZ domain
VKKPSKRLSFAASLLLLAGQAQARETASTHYEVRYLGDDRFHVEARFAQPVTRLDLSDHGATGRPTGQSASVRELRAYDAKGKSIAIEFIGDGTWVMKHGAAGRVSYDLVADHDAVTWRAGKEEVASRFDDTFYFVGDAFFLVDYQGEKSPIELEFDLPAGWQVTSPWSGAGNKFFASNPDALGSNAFAMGRNLPSTVDIGGLRLTWLADSRVATASARMAPLFERLPATYTEFWGGTPGDRLNIFLLSDRMTDGGAFKNSFAMRLDTPLRESEAAIWSHTLAHELMHIWMNQSNDGIGRAPGGSHAWFTEGFTDYLTIKLMRQAGLIDQAMAAQRVANLIRRYRLGRRLSPGLGLFAAGERKHDNWELVYGGGAMVALLLDASLSNESPLAFRDTLRRLQHLGGKPMDGAAMLAALDQGSAGRASEIFRALDAGLSLEELRQRLAASGIGVEGYATDEVYVALPACSKIMCPETAASASADAMLLPLQLRTREAMATLQSLDAGTLDSSAKAILACMRGRFGEARLEDSADRPKSVELRKAEGLIAAYRRYWRQALLSGSDQASLDAASATLLSELRQVLGAPADADWARVDEGVKTLFDTLGWHVLRGITPPLRELIVWAREHVEDEQAALPDGPEAVRVVFMSDFKSRGWAHYATCGRSSAGGWTGTDRLHAVADTYDRSSERYRVSYLAHEGQHFRDVRRFTGTNALPAWHLEYRAKLAELALARERQADLLAVFANDTSNDPELPHSHANQRVMAALDKALPNHRPWRTATSWTEAEADALRSAARANLASDELDLQASAPDTPGGSR